ncbi:indole-3-glycerol phosphate synthase TrpC [bacterium]|nr:indole-3-glycerol phosphate synthase TrpC [bacterium]
MDSILDNIVSARREDIAAAKARVPLSELEAQCYAIAAPRDFQAAVETPKAKTAIVAEIKRASPSRGVLRADLDPAALARAYEAGGAAALSVLTEPNFFKARPSDLTEARGACRLPVLRKDFLIDEYQLYETCAMGADACLLIVRLMDEAELRDFVMLAHELSIAALVETHSAGEIERAQRADARLIGINNRDLATFEVALERTIELAKNVDAHRTVISESGIGSAADLARLRDAGVRAALVGESLVTSDDPALCIRELLA